MTEIDARLRQMGSSLDWPNTPDLGRHLVLSVDGGRRRRRLVPVLAGAIVVVVALAIIPATRDDLLAFFGIRGLVIEQGGITDEIDVAELGMKVDLTTAEAALGAPLDDLGRAGRAGAVFLDSAGRVWMTLEPSPALRQGGLLTIFDADRTPDLVKRVFDPALQARQVTVNGQPAMWVTGDDHAVLFEVEPGTIELAEGKLSGNALIWESDRLTYRLEADVDLELAIAIAESMP